MIVSPNLYRDNLILDYILQEKLLSQEIDPMDLLEGDRDAIILFLRASGYGNEYPISATDEETGKIKGCFPLKSKNLGKGWIALYQQAISNIADMNLTNENFSYTISRR